MSIKYDPAIEGFIIRELATGKSIKETAKKIGISLNTWYKLEKRYPTFFMAVRIGRRICFDRVIERFE